MHGLRLAALGLAWGSSPCWLAACGSGGEPVETEVAPLGPARNGPTDRGEGRPDASSVALPDLVLDAAYLLETIAEDHVVVDDRCLLVRGCVTGLGERRVVRFGMRTGNLGNADLRLGTPSLGNPYWTFDACKREFALVGFARYELLAASSGEVVATGGKNGFCIRDTEAYEPEGGPRCATYDCDRQGIGLGCSDNYGSALECQWIDISEVPVGAYTLRVTLNASLAIAELDYANDVAEVALDIGEGEVVVER